MFEDLDEVIVAMAVRPSAMLGVGVNGDGLCSSGGEGRFDVEDADGVVGVDIFTLEVFTKDVYQRTRGTGRTMFATIECIIHEDIEYIAIGLHERAGGLIMVHV